MPSLIVFVKTPRLGQVKTRLARETSDEFALQVYRQLLRHTLRATRHWRDRRCVFYADRVPETDPWQRAGFEPFAQVGNSLGERLEQAFATVGCPALVIGSDCPQLRPLHLRRAARWLRRRPAVIGPCPDGGYYLLGMRHSIPEIFQRIDWSTPRVLQQTLARLERACLQPFLLPQLRDVDNLDDWKALLSPPAEDGRTGL